jgi:hypothetical protein
LRLDKRMPLFLEGDMLDAFACAERANVSVPSHRPFVIVRVRSMESVVVDDT